MPMFDMVFYFPFSVFSYHDSCHDNTMMFYFEKKDMTKLGKSGNTEIVDMICWNMSIMTF